MASIKSLGFLSLFSFLLVVCSCSQKSDYDFTSKWQSLNDSGLVVEIDEDDNYWLIRNGKSMLDDLVDFDQLKIEINGTRDAWNNFVIRAKETGEEFSKGRIEIVDKDRIRIYFHKHHDILDLADEFYRVKDLESYDEVMNSIRAEG